MKFSIIVPVYNVEAYIEKCLSSIKKQSYNNFEVIIVNDGSMENEEKIIKKYLSDKRFTYYVKKNGGLSDARNYGLKYATGDYILFIDSDDYIETNLLSKINAKLMGNKVDILKFDLNIVDENNNVLQETINYPFDNVIRRKAIRNILNGSHIDMACIYVYKLDFWKNNNFSYPKGKIHEDFALTPIVLSKAKTIISISYKGYNYVQHNGSITSQKSYDKIYKRVNDFKEHYLLHKKTFRKMNNVEKDLLGYSAFSLICKVRELNDDDRKEYLKFIKKEKLVSKITSINFKRMLLKIYLTLFLNRFIEKKHKEFINE